MGPLSRSARHNFKYKTRPNSNQPRIMAQKPNTKESINAATHAETVRDLVLKRRTARASAQQTSASTTEAKTETHPVTEH